MTKTNIKIGDAIIINEADRPCTSLVAIVTAIDTSGAVSARYLNKKLSTREKDKKQIPCIITDSSPFEATALCDFGVILFATYDSMGGNSFRCFPDPKNPCVATYGRDGKLRPWQEVFLDCDENGWCLVDEDVLRLWNGRIL